MNRYQQLLQVLAAFVPVYPGTAAVYDLVNDNPQVLAGIVTCYKQGVAAMAQNAIAWKCEGGPKPEWIEHAGL